MKKSKTQVNFHLFICIHSFKIVLTLYWQSYLLTFSLFIVFFNSFDAILVILVLFQEVVEYVQSTYFIRRCSFFVLNFLYPKEELRLLAIKDT